MQVFVDESGKPEVFSIRGRNLVADGVASKHLVIAAVKTNDQLELQRRVTQFRANLMADKEVTKLVSTSYALDAFHANPDYPVVRRKFYEFITTLDCIEIQVIVNEKLRSNPRMLADPTYMYSVISGMLLHSMTHQDEETEVVFSRQDNSRTTREQLELEVERIQHYEWSRHKRPPKNLHLTYKHNPHYTHAGLQIADYVAYGVFKWFEFGDPTWLKLIQPSIRHINHFNNKEHFTRSKPLELSS